MIVGLKEYTEGVEPMCPDCGTPGVLGWQESGIVDNFFTLIDVYVCPKCHPEILPELEQMA